MSKPAPVFAIDGQAGSGKGTIAQMLAGELGWHYLDSGALYRGVAVAVLQQKQDPQDETQVAQVVHSLDLEFTPEVSAMRVRLSGVDISQRIREPDVGACVSQVAAHPAVRGALLAYQRSMRRTPGLVAEGRDMATTVFPGACVKVYLSASLEERAHRRLRQLKEMHIDANLASLIEELGQRDRLDTHRETSPLVKAPDAFLIDTTGQSIEKVYAQVRTLLPSRYTQG